MDKIEKIKAEIERLRKANEVSEDKEYAQYELDVKDGYDLALNDILSFIDSLPKEPVSSMWHNASEEPADKANCLIYYKVGDNVSYQDVFSVLYHKERKEFVSEPYPHPTGYKVEQKSLEGGATAVVCKNMRDKFPLADISKWAYLKDLLYKQEEPVSEDLEEAAQQWYDSTKFKSDLSGTPIGAFKAGAKWQKRIDDIIKRNIHNNAVKYGKRQIINAACEYLWRQMWPDNKIDDFRKELEEG